MFDKGLFGGLFDLDRDGKTDSFEKAAELAAFMHIVNESENEDENDEAEEFLADAGLDLSDLELMDDDERTEALEDAGLDPDDFDF